jgi:hypothetical protein
MSRPNLSKPTSIRPPFVPRTIINSRIIDPTIIAKLFLICQEGQITNIKDYILKNGLTANDLVNTDGQSILHVILLNDSITSREKTDIFKFLASRNLLKFSYDSQQKTPLHIASEKQLTEIVKILLHASHDVNALDSTRRTPIYYAITGKEVDCPKIQKPIIEQKKTFKLSLQDELNQEIVKFINDNVDIKNILLHLYNTTKNLDSIYYDEITKILEEDNKKIMDILITEKDEEKKKDKIFEKVYETKNSIINMFIKEKFTNTLRPISFNKVDANTWSPNANPVNKFLNDVEPSIILKEFELDYEKQKVNVIEELDKIFTKNITNFAEIKDKFLQGIENGIYDLNFYSILYSILGGYFTQSLSGGSKNSKNQKKNKKIIKKIIKKYEQLGGATADEITQVITFMTTNIAGLSAEADIMNVLPQIIGEMIDNTTLFPNFIDRFTKTPINLNYVGHICAQVIEKNNALANNGLIYRGLLANQNIFNIFIRYSNDKIAKIFAETIYNTYQTNNAILNNANIQILELKPSILTHLSGFNNGQLFPILVNNLINVINNNNNLLNDINFIAALNSALTNFPTLISNHRQLGITIGNALSTIIQDDHSFIYDKLLIEEYQKNNELLGRLINKLIPILIDTQMIKDPRLINLLQNNKQLFEKILEKFNTVNLTVARLVLTPIRITNLTALFVSALIHYNLADTINGELNRIYLDLDPQLLNSIQAIINNPMLVTNLKNAYTSHPTIARITGRFAQFQPDDNVKRALTQVLNNMPPPPINVANDDEIARLFSDAINVNNQITMNETFIKFIITNQPLLLKIVEEQQKSSKDENIYAIFENSMKAIGSKIGILDPTKQYLINNHKIIQKLLNNTRGIPVKLLVDLIKQILITPNSDNFINEIINEKINLESNKSLTAELVNQAKGPLLLSIAKLLCVITNNHENAELVNNLAKNPELLQELCSNELKVDIINIMSNENISKLIQAITIVPRSTISKNTNLINKIRDNRDLAIELCKEIYQIPEDMISNIIILLLDNYNILDDTKKNELKNNLKDNFNALEEIIKKNRKTDTQNILSDILFDYFTTYNNPEISRIAPAFIVNRDQLFRLIDNDILKNPTDKIRKNLALLILECIILDRSLLNDKNIIKLLINEKSVINYLIDKFARFSEKITYDEIANFIKIFIIKNNAVLSKSLVKLKPEIMLKIIESEYSSQLEYNMIAQTILNMIDRNINYFNKIFTQLVMIIKDSKPELLQVLANRLITTNNNHYTFVAKLLNEILNSDPNFLDSNKVIKSILLNNSELIRKMNEMKGLVPIVIGRLDVKNIESMCKYEGDLTFIDRRINDQTVYDINKLSDDIMQNPTKPITKYNDDFFSEYDQLILDHQADFIQFNEGKNFIRKIKIIHTKITSIYNDIGTIIGAIKTEFTKTLQTIDLKILFENIVSINAQLISLVNYITLFHSEFNLVKVKLNKLITSLREEVKILKIENKSINLPSKNKKIEYHLFYESLLKMFEKIDSTTKIDLIQDCYKNIIELQESLNKFINFINTISATKYIIYFSNDLIDFDRIFTNNKTSNIKYLFNRNISHFPKLYSKLDTLLSELTQDIQTDKINMVNKFVPQFNQYNYFSYYQDRNIQPIIGFMIPPNYLNRVILNGEPKLTYGKNGIYGEIEDADTTNDNNLLKYTIGIKNNITPEKKEKTISSINLLLDKHFLIIKNFIIRRLIKQLYEILQTKKNGGKTAGKESLEILLFKTYSQIRENLNLPEDNLQLFLIMLAKNIDKILSANLTNFILNGITRFGFREKRHRELDLILNKIADIKTSGVTDDNTIQIVHIDLEQLIKPDDIIAVIKADPKAYRIEYEQPILSAKITKYKKIKPIGINDINDINHINDINDINDLNNNKCVKIDIELIELLLKAKASTTGLIIQAIESNNVDLVKLLINASSVYNEKSRDVNGLRPFDLTLSQIKYYGSITDASIINNLIEESSTEISKKTSSTLQMRYHDLFYKIFYVLFNHLLLDLTNQMKYDNKKKLRKKLKFTKEVFPMKDMIKDIMVKQIGDEYIEDKTNVKSQIVEVETKDNDDKIKMEKDITNKIIELKKELDDKDDKPTEIRKQIIEDELRELEAKLLSLKSLNIEKRNLELKQNKNELKKIDNIYYSDIITKKINTMNKEKNFMKMYQSLDNKVFEKDIKTVNNVWSSIFKKYKLEDIDIDIISKLSTYIQTQVTFEDLYVELKDYINGIVQFASDYTELDQQLHSTNYALEKIYEILTYIINHTISINLKNIIQQLLRNELTRISPQQTMTIEVYSKFIDEKIKAIFETTKLDEYIYKILPEKIIITIFNLDPGNKTELQNHFEYITKILSLNGVLPITIESEIVKTLTNTIYSYFAIYADINLKKIKIFINGIFNIFDNLNNSLEIYKIILDKAKTENIN